MSFPWLFNLIEKIANLVDVVITIKIINGRIALVDFDPVKESEKSET